MMHGPANFKFKSN